MKYSDLSSSAHGSQAVVSGTHVRLFVAGVNHETRASRILFSIEDQLTAAVRGFRDRHNKIENCLATWTQTKKNAIFATDQLGYALQRWDQCEKLKKIEKSRDVFYKAIQEAQRHLGSATQGLQMVNELMPSNIRIPFLTKSDIKPLRALAENMFIDSVTKSRHQKTRTFITGLWKKTGALSQWIDLTTEQSIMPDYEKSRETLRAMMSSLGAEREKLIQSVLVRTNGEELIEVIKCFHNSGLVGISCHEEHVMSFCFLAYNRGPGTAGAGSCNG